MRINIRFYKLKFCVLQTQILGQKIDRKTKKIDVYR